MTNILMAQTNDAVKNLVEDGIELHNNGEYNAAITKYDKALAIDTGNLLAMTEKAYSLVAIHKFEESIIYCKKVLEKNPADKRFSTLYVCYGNALDGLNQKDNAIAMYDEGIKKFPGNSLLYFNKGVALYSIYRDEEAIQNLQKSLLINPNHASSHNLLGHELQLNKNRIPAIMAFSRFLVLEPLGKRSVENLEIIKDLIKGNVEKRKDSSVAITMPSENRKESTGGNNQKDNNFRPAEVMLSMASAMDIDDNKSKSAIAALADKFALLCSSLKQYAKDNHGFYWSFYAPYFIEMKERNLLQTFAYIISASSDDQTVQPWLDSHKKEVNEFYDWSDNYSWNNH